MTTPRSSTGIETAPTIEPDLSRLVPALALLYLEVEAGCRPAHQVRGLVSPALYERLTVRPRTGRRTRRVPSARAIRAVHCSSPRPDAVEASVVVCAPPRTTALAIRLERHVGRWRMVELSRPEDGEPPRRTSSLEHRSVRPDAFDDET